MTPPFDPTMDVGYRPDAEAPQLPDWLRAGRPHGMEDAAFFSGAALANLDGMLQRGRLPMAILRDRLALGAAERCLVLVGRPEGARSLRDEVHLLRPGDRPGPGGAMFALWRRAVARPATPQGLNGVLPEPIRQEIPAARPHSGQSPVVAAAAALEMALLACPREEAAALILADAVLARALGWERLVPMLGSGLARRDLRGTGADLRLACHRSLVVAVGEALALAGDLARRAARLRDAAPKLRAKRAGAAVQLFLERDALSPSLALTHLMSDRAARRLCDRLVALGAVRELTGRTTSRLYGL